MVYASHAYQAIKTNNTFKNMDESQKYYAMWKNPDIKGLYIYNINPFIWYSGYGKSIGNLNKNILSRYACFGSTYTRIYYLEKKNKEIPKDFLFLHVSIYLPTQKDMHMDTHTHLKLKTSLWDK